MLHTEKKPVDGHPFVKTGKEALKLGRVPHDVIKDLEEYLKFVEMCTAKHNVEAGDKDMAFNLLTRNDIKISYKKILLSTILSTAIENNFPELSEFLQKKVFSSKYIYDKIYKI